MIEKILLATGKNLKSAEINWDENQEDYIINIPDGIKRCDLIDLIDEIKRITQWED